MKLGHDFDDRLAELPKRERRHLLREQHWAHVRRRAVVALGVPIVVIFGMEAMFAWGAVPQPPRVAGAILQGSVWAAALLLFMKGYRDRLRREIVRRDPSLCPHCGHRARGAATCPECGRDRNAKR